MKLFLSLTRNAFILAVIIMSGSIMKAQEFNAQVVVNAQQSSNSNLSVFKTLERSVQEFVNQTNWTNKKYSQQERINCSMFITILEQEGQNFKATIQVQSTRPVYGSTLETTVFNFNDEQFSFVYTEYQPLAYDPNSFDSNLISVVAFYVYTMLGLDGDTFAPEGGTVYHEEAQQIVNTAQQSSTVGWKPTDGTKSRFRLNADILANAFKNYRSALYLHHRQGLDLMHKDQKEAKTNVANAIAELRTMYSSRPNSLLNRIYFDAKADEVEAIFKDGPSVDVKNLTDNLNAIAPFYSDNWKNIKF